MRREFYKGGILKVEYPVEELGEFHELVWNGVYRAWDEKGYITDHWLYLNDTEHGIAQQWIRKERYSIRQFKDGQTHGVNIYLFELSDLWQK